MMDPMKSVVKSKSSNTAIVTNVLSKIRNARIQCGTKRKSWSSAEFNKSCGVKKRGVYVEKKDSGNSNDGPGKQLKAPPRPRRGTKLFLKSALNILSLDTTGTQFPEENDPGKKLKNTKKRKVKRELETTETSTQMETVAEKPDVRLKKTAKVLNKYRSKALNNEAQRKNREQIVVLKARKDLDDTASMCSIKSNKEPPLGLLNKIGTDIEVETDIPKNKNPKPNKSVRIAEPNTLVSEQKGTEHKDETVYNFFVDVLENTIDGYNLERSVSKVKFEIDETVARKLETKSKPDKVDDNKNQQNDFNSQRFIVRDDGVLLTWNEQNIQVLKKQPTYRNEPPLQKVPKRRMLSKSFSFASPYTALSPRASLDLNRVEKPKKRTLRNTRKTLLNVLKEELKMDDDIFEEPQNMHQALKIIAKNQRRCRKAIHFADVNANGGDDEEYNKTDCFKRKKIISRSTKTKKRNRRRKNDDNADFMRSIKTAYLREQTEQDIFTKGQRTAMYLNTDPQNYIEVSSGEDSVASIEVQGFDYDVDMNRRVTDFKNKSVVFAAVSSETIKPKQNRKNSNRNCSPCESDIDIQSMQSFINRVDSDFLPKETNIMLKALI